ncbi:MAG: hypothetical protein ACOYD0_06160 [Candidatus Nanopelagicales bacterium]
MKKLATAMTVIALAGGLAACSITSTTTTQTTPSTTTTPPTTPSPTLPTITTAQMCTEHIDGLGSMLTLLNKDRTLANANPAKVAAYKAEFTQLSQQTPPPANTAFGTLANNMTIGGADKDAVADAGQTIVDMCKTYLSSVKASRP